jgi:hypothetical protein
VDRKANTQAVETLDAVQLAQFSGYSADIAVAT